MSELNDIIKAMVRIEQAGLTSVHPAFQSTGRLPDTIESTPLAFRLNVMGGPTGLETANRQGVGIIQQYQPLVKWEYTIQTAITVGFLSNKLEDLDALAAKFIIPWYDLYAANYKLPDEHGEPTVDYIVMGQFQMGQYKPLDTVHYGVVFTIVARQTQRRAHAPGTP